MGAKRSPIWGMKTGMKRGMETEKKISMFGVKGRREKRMENA